MFIYSTVMLQQKTPLHQELHPSEPVLLIHTEGHRCAGQRRHSVFPRKCRMYKAAISGE